MHRQNSTYTEFYKFIHLLSIIRFTFGGSGGAGADPSWARSGAHSGLVASSSWGWHTVTEKHSRTHLANKPRLHVFGLWVEAKAPGGNPRRQWRNTQKGPCRLPGFKNSKNINCTRSAHLLFVWNINVMCITMWRILQAKLSNFPVCYLPQASHDDVDGKCTRSAGQSKPHTVHFVAYHLSFG